MDTINNIMAMNQMVVLTAGQIQAIVNNAVELAVEKLLNKAQCGGNSNDNNEEYLSREEAAKILHVDLSTLHRWAKEGKLIPHKAGDRRVLYSRSEVLAYINMKGKHDKKPVGEIKGKEEAV